MPAIKIIIHISIHFNFLPSLSLKRDRNLHIDFSSFIYYFIPYIAQIEKNTSYFNHDRSYNLLHHIIKLLE